MPWFKTTRRAFVSSTYTDLQESRRLVADQLVSARILPIGMEVFPAAGEGPWEVIKSAIEAADLYILLVGGRYGSIAPETVAGRPGVSWTKAEYEYARSLGKPIIGLIHSDVQRLAAGQVDSDRTAVDDFRSELQSSILAKLFCTDADLVSGLHTSLLHLMDTQDWEEIAPDRATTTQSIDDFLRRSYDRKFDFVGANWSHRASEKHPDRWDATCQVSRALRAQWPEGVRSMAYKLTKPSGDYDCFFGEDPPSLALSEWERAEAGKVSVRQTPRAISRSSYTHDIDFDPALREGELCTLKFKVSLPGYRYAYCDEVRQASQSALAGVRDFEHVSFQISYPTDRLVLSASFPRSLNAEILGFGVRKGSASKDLEEAARIEKLRCFGVTTMDDEREGEIVVATMDIPNPVFRRTYEIRWRAPRRT